VAGGKTAEKSGDDFHRFALRLCDAGGVVAQLLDSFPLKVASRVIDVAYAKAIGERSQTPGGEHLHHQRRAGAWQAGNDGNQEAPAWLRLACNSAMER